VFSFHTFCCLAARSIFVFFPWSRYDIASPSFEVHVEAMSFEDEKRGIEGKEKGRG